MKKNQNKSQGAQMEKILLFPKLNFNFNEWRNRAEREEEEKGGHTAANALIPFS